jgi:hypothetical protein
MTSQESSRPTDDAGPGRTDGTESMDPEEFADAAGIDPTPQEVDEYLELAKKQPPWSSA